MIEGYISEGTIRLTGIKTFGWKLVETDNNKIIKSGDWHSTEKSAKKAMQQAYDTLERNDL